MSSIFDEFYNNDSEDEARPNQNHFFSEARRLSLANGFEIAQTRPTLRNIAALSFKFPWLWENTSWIIYEIVGPWRLLNRWRFRVHNIYNYELALGSTIDKDSSPQREGNFFHSQEQFTICRYNQNNTRSCRMFQECWMHNQPELSWRFESSIF